MKRGHPERALEEFWPAYVDILMVVALILVMLVLTFVLARPDTRVREEQERRKAEFAAAFHRALGDEERAGLVTLLSPPGETQVVTFADQLLFDSGDEITVQAGEEGIRFLLVSGRPIEEPVAWYGPIVMNTREELDTAFAEYQAGTFVKSGADAG